MQQIRSGLFGKVKFVVYVENSFDRPNLSDVYLNIYDMVEQDFVNSLAQAFSISGLENIGKDFFKNLGQDLLTIGQDIIDSQYEEIEDEIFNKMENDVKVENEATIEDNSKDSMLTHKESVNDSYSEQLTDMIVESYEDESSKNITKTCQTESRQYSCKFPLCDYSSSDNKVLNDHSEKEHGAEKVVKSYTCPACPEFISATKKNLDEHIFSLHRELKKFSCAECDYKSNFQMNVKRHIDIKHKGLSGDHLCSYCPKRFFSPAKLKSHILVHTNEKNFVCEECAAKFKRKDDLKAHLKIHEPDEIRAKEKAKKMVHVCHTCGKKFEKNWKLKRHMVVHSKNVVTVCT